MTDSIYFFHLFRPVWPVYISYSNHGTSLRFCHCGLTATTRTATTRQSYIQNFPLPIGRSLDSRRDKHIFRISLCPQGVHRVHTSLLRFSYLGRGYRRKRGECKKNKDIRILAEKRSEDYFVGSTQLYFSPGT